MFFLNWSELYLGILNSLDHTEPKIDHDKALVQDFKSLVERESKEERMKGTKGEKIIR